MECPTNAGDGEGLSGEVAIQFSSAAFEGSLADLPLAAFGWRDTERAMSQENVEIVRRAGEAYERGDLSAVLETFSPDLVTYVAPPFPVAGTYQGPEGFLQLTLDWAEGFDELDVRAEEHFDAGDKVITRARHRARGAESDVPVETDVWYVWTIRSGKTVRADIFNDRQEALEAAGLSE